MRSIVDWTAIGSVIGVVSFIAIASVAAGCFFYVRRRRGRAGQGRGQSRKGGGRKQRKEQEQVNDNKNLIDELPMVITVAGRGQRSMTHKREIS